MTETTKAMERLETESAKQKLEKHYHQMARLEQAEKAVCLDDARKLLEYERVTRAEHENRLEEEGDMSPDDMKADDMILVGDQITINPEPKKAPATQNGMSAVAKIGAAALIAAGGASIPAAGALGWWLANKPAATSTTDTDTQFLLEAAE